MYHRYNKLSELNIQLIVDIAHRMGSDREYDICSNYDRNKMIERAVFEKEMYPYERVKRCEQGRLKNTLDNYKQFLDKYGRVNVKGLTK